MTWGGFVLTSVSHNPIYFRSLLQITRAYVTSATSPATVQCSDKIWLDRKSEGDEGGRNYLASDRKKWQQFFRLINRVHLSTRKKHLSTGLIRRGCASRPPLRRRSGPYRHIFHPAALRLKCALMYEGLPGISWTCWQHKQQLLNPHWVIRTPVKFKRSAQRTSGIWGLQFRRKYLLIKSYINKKREMFINIR